MYLSTGLLKEKSMLEDNIESLQKTILENKKENDGNLKKICSLKKVSYISI